MKTKLMKLSISIILIAAFLGISAGYQFDVFAVHFICEFVGFLAILGCLSLAIAIIVSIDDKKGEKEDVK